MVYWAVKSQPSPSLCPLGHDTSYPDNQTHLFPRAQVEGYHQRFSPHSKKVKPKNYTVPTLFTESTCVSLHAVCMSPYLCMIPSVVIASSLSVAGHCCFNTGVMVTNNGLLNQWLLFPSVQYRWSSPLQYYDTISSSHLSVA